MSDRSRSSPIRKRPAIRRAVPRTASSYSSVSYLHKVENWPSSSFTRIWCNRQQAYPLTDIVRSGSWYNCTQAGKNFQMEPLAKAELIRACAADVPDRGRNSRVV